MSLLRVENLGLEIHGAPILRNVSLTVDRGGILGVVGESGSGKSMTAYSVMQLLPRGAKSSGQITFEDHDILSLSEDQLCKLRGYKIGMIFQEPMTALNPLKTIGDQVAETVRIHGKAGKAEALKIARDTLDRVELPGDKFPLSRYPHELSGGQRQRVVIAMAIALQPALLIADEPTTALDVTTQAEILRLLKRLVMEDNMAMIIITHDLAVVSDLADDMIIMKSGEIVERGPAKSLFRDMQHPYTKALFAASSHVPDSGQPVSEQAEPLLVLKDVVRDYYVPSKVFLGKPSSFRAVDHVSFELRSGEKLGLIGESGCGKSTLTRAILGLEKVQGGSITLSGKSVFAEKGVDSVARRKMQVVFQDPYGSFNPRHRVSRLVAEPMNLFETQPSQAERDRLIAKMMESVGLKPSDADRYIHEFSGGQRQRIAIARALIIQPELIILDEAVSALDVSIRAQILDLLSDLSSEFGLSYLFISHDLSVVRSLTDRVLIMKDGQIVEHGETETVFQNPQHTYTKTLIDAAPVLPAVG